ncbi:MAG: hypothetical protein U1E15_04160 [Hyphomicrobiales bacterium]
MKKLAQNVLSAFFRHATDHEPRSDFDRSNDNHRPLLAADRLSGTSYEFMLPELLQDVSSRSGRIG